MRHWYVVFPTTVTEKAAHTWLKKWGAEPEVEQTMPDLGGELCLAVRGPVNLPLRAKEVPGVQVYDNESRAELLTK